MISLVLCTYRPGVFDLLAHSVTATKGDWELIVVDDMPGRVERKTVPKFLMEKGIPLGWYGPSKPKSYPDAKGGLCNAWNTALSHARGDFIVFVSDYTLLPASWLLEWENLRKFWGDKTLISGGAGVFSIPKPNLWDDVLSGVSLGQMAFLWPWVAWHWESFYCGVPMAFYKVCNGMDERADHCHCWPVSSDVARAKKLGYRLTVVPELACIMLDHRSWDNESEKAPAGCGGEGLWRITDKQSIEKEPEWDVPAKNAGWSLAEERRKNELQNR